MVKEPVTLIYMPTVYDYDEQYDRGSLLLMVMFLY